MKQSLIIVIGFFGGLGGLVTAQPSTFDTLYTQGHIGYKIIPNHPGYLIAGDNHTEDFWLFQTNDEGKLLWEKSYGRRYGLFDASLMRDTEQATDGSIFMAGHSYSIPDTNWGKYFGYVVKVDSLGNQLWDKLFYTTYDSSRASKFRNVLPTSDGGCLLTGSIITNPDVTVPSATRFYLVKLDSLGEVEYEKIYRNGSETLMSESGTSDGIELPDNQGFLIGASYNQGIEGYLMKLNLLGDTLWTKRYPRLPGSHPREWLVVEDILSVSTNGDHLLAMGGYLAKVDSNGVLQWINADAKSTRITLLNQDNLIGNMSDVIQKINPSGAVLWQRDYSSYGFVTTDFIRFVEVIPAKDEGYMILYNSLSGLGLMKTDCDGNVVNPIACSTTSLQRPQFELTLQVAYQPDAWAVNYNLPVRGATLSLCNLMGQQLTSLPLSSQSEEIKVSHNGLAAGLYLIQIRDAQGSLLGSQKVWAN